MKVATSKVYQADDGKEFASKEECRAYEERDVFKPLLNLKAEHITAILNGEDKTRGRLIRKLAEKYQRTLRSRGEYTPRPRKNAGNGAATEQQTAEQQQHL